MGVASALGDRLAGDGGAGLVVGLAVAYVYTTLPEYQALMDGRARGSVTLLDRQGDVFAWRGDQFGGVVTADTVSPNLKNAVIATEDRRFYMHPGIDPIGIASAMRINLSEGRGPFSGQWRVDHHATDREASVFRCRL